jgi:uncharacterized protein
VIPDFLGLIPTRGCNLACAYCGFLTGPEAEQVMDLRLAKQAVDWYLETVKEAGQREAAVHFFGGEPLVEAEVVDLAYHAAVLKGAELGCTVRFETATNGVYSEARCQWLADSFDGVILSLDGPANVQDRHRARHDERGSYEAVARSAHILSAGQAELSIRACVTAATVDRIPETAAWLCHEFAPMAVSFEPLQPTEASRAAGLRPPEPLDFARRYMEAASIVEAHGIEAVYATADIGTLRVSFCPVGRDVAIVSPDGAIDACYLQRRDWEAKGLDLRLGQMQDGAVWMDGSAVERARAMNVWNEPLCAGCFCRWHCAGGCHVNHTLSTVPGDYDGLCIQTRLITLRNILTALGRADLVERLWAEPEILEAAAWQPEDSLMNAELGS